MKKTEVLLPGAGLLERSAVMVPTRKRPKPGERRVQILQALATMLEQPGAERVTTAALAARLGVSEAALYRHFASKAQMFEKLIDFIEQSIFTLIDQILEQGGAASFANGHTSGQRAGRIVTMLLQFAEKNPGMARVMVGDALVFENERLQQRMNQFFDKIETTLHQTLHDTAAGQDLAASTTNAQMRASALTAFMVGRLQRYARSGFRRAPSEHLEATITLLV